MFKYYVLIEEEDEKVKDDYDEGIRNKNKTFKIENIYWIFSQFIFA